MDPNQLVFDISSDEEPAWEDLLSEVLGAVDRGFDDPDEVVCIGEVNPCKMSKPSKPKSKYVDDDDECVVLEGDPDKPLEVANEGGDDGDELMVVGQKGEIACRDLPHSRHLCAKFKFNSTSHEKYCELCHCFVCDTRAPCKWWGSGSSNTDHCHATDKEERWNTLRKKIRLLRNAPVPVSKFPVAPPPIAAAHINNVPRHDIIQLASHSTPRSQVSRPIAQNQVSRPMPQNQVSRPIPQNQVSRPPIPQNQVSRPIMTALGNSMSQNQISRPSIIHPFSSSNRFNTPNIISQPKSQLSQISEFGSNRINLQTRPHSILQHSLGPRSTAIRKDRGHGINMSSHIISSDTLSKRVNGRGAAGVNQTAYGLSESITSVHTAQHAQNSAAVATRNDRNPIGWQNLGSGTNLETCMLQSSSQPNMGGVYTSTAPSQSALYSQPIPQSIDGQSINQFGSYSQPITNSSTDFDIGLVNNNSQSPIDNVQLQTTLSTNEQLSIKEMADRARLHFDDDLHDFDFLYEDQSFPVVQDGYMPPGPPEPVYFDAGMRLFDFEPLGMA